MDNLIYNYLMKICSKCNTKKDLNQFYKDSYKKDG